MTTHKQGMPDDLKEKILEAADKHGFRVPYDGSNNFYDDKAIKSFIEGAEYLFSILPAMQTSIPDNLQEIAEDYARKNYQSLSPYQASMLGFIAGVMSKQHLTEPAPDQPALEVMKIYKVMPDSPFKKFLSQWFSKYDPDEPVKDRGLTINLPNGEILTEQKVVPDSGKVKPSWWFDRICPETNKECSSGFCRDACSIQEVAKHGPFISEQPKQPVSDAVEQEKIWEDLMLSHYQFVHNHKVRQFIESLLSKYNITKK